MSGNVVGDTATGGPDLPALRQLVQVVVSRLHPAISPALSLWSGQLPPPAPGHLSLLPLRPLHPVPKVGP